MICVLVLSGGENDKIFLWSFSEHPKVILRSGDLNPLLSDQGFEISVSESKFSEGKVDVIISTQSYWNYYDFCTA